jgi:hypothetical protein
MGRQARYRLIIHGGSHNNHMTEFKQYGLKAENLSRLVGFYQRRWLLIGLVKHMTRT